VSLRIGVMGAGAIGCYLGGMLAHSSRAVTFVGSERLCSEVSSSGLVLTDMEHRTRRVSGQQLSYVTDAAALATVDLVMVATKSAQTVQAGELLSRVLQPQAIVVSVQNGMRNAELLRAALPHHAVLTGIVGFNVRYFGAGAFRQTTTGPLVFEASDHAEVVEVAQVLADCGLEVELRHDIRSLQWTKLIMNLSNAISALSGAPTPQLLFNARYRAVLRAVMQEAIGVLRAANVRPGKLGTLPVAMFPFMLGLPTLLLRVALRAQLKVDPDARSSMWDDLVRGRTTEVDELNGAIVRLADANGCDAPLNRRIVAAVHEFEARRAGSPTLSPQGLEELLGLELRNERPG
jgi:2-dehydropantoate 2-reductase